MKKRGTLIIVFLLVLVLNVNADDSPVVTLNAPTTASTISTGSIVFNFSVADDNLIANCSLFGNFSTAWTLNQTIGTLSKTHYETANESSVGVGVKTIDGNWSTYEARDNYTYYMNYSKPDADAALWTISGGIGIDHAPTNYSVPTECWNYDANKLLFRAITNKDNTGQSYWYCRYAAGWKVVKNYNGGKGFWEEAVWWISSSIDNNTITNFNSMQIAEGYYQWNVKCYDNAGQQDWGDSNFTLTIGTPVAPPPPPPPPSGGGGGGGGTPPEEPEEEPEEEAIVPEEGETTLNENQVTEVRGSTALSYTPSLTGISLDEETIKLSLVNTGEKIIKDIEVIIEQPPVEEKPNLPHTRRIYGWDKLSLTGWATSSYVQEPALLEWEITDPQNYDELKPGESIDIDLGIKTPLTKKKMINLKFDIKSFGKSIYSETVPVEIDTTEFLVIADVHPEKNLADIYMVVTNQKDEADSHYVELNFNKDGKTVGAEFYGPYEIQARETMLFAYQYEYSEGFADDYELKYTLYHEVGKEKESYGEIKLT